MAEKAKRTGYGTYTYGETSSAVEGTKNKRVGYGTISEEAAIKSTAQTNKQLIEAAKELGVSLIPKTDYSKPEYDLETGTYKTPQQKFSENISQTMSGDNYTKYLQTEIDKKLKENETSRQEIINFDTVAAEKEIADLEKKLAGMPSANWDTRGNMGQVQAQKNADAVNEIKAQIAEKKMALTQKKRLQELLKNNETATSDPNFNKYVKSGKETPWSSVAKATGTSGGPNMSKTTYDDLGAAAWALYKHNNPNAEKPLFDNLDNASLYEQMTDAEFDLLAYYIGKDKETGGNQAETYVELMKETLQTRKGQEIYEQYLKDNTVLEILYGVPAGLDQFANGVTSLFNFKDDYIPASPVQVAGSLAREDLADDTLLGIEIFGSSLGQMAYDTVQTTANMAPSIAASMLVGLVNPTAGAVTGGMLMGGSAAGNAYQEALNNGWGKGEARTYSLLIGASEALLSATVSKVFGGKLVSDVVENAIKGVTNGFARFALNYGAAFVSEGLEEAAQEVLSPLFENIAFGYNRKGFEDIDWAEVAYSFLLGGLSGGMFETAGSGVKRVSSVVSVMKEYNTAEKTQNLLKLALSFPTESKANKLATQYNSQLKKNGKLSVNKVYNLAVATENVLTERLTQLGEKKNAPAIASAARKAVTTGQLTEKEMALLHSSENGAKLLEEINVTLEAENPVLQSSANDQNVPPAGVSGTNNGTNDTFSGASGSFSGTNSQNSETVAAKNNNTALDGVIDESQVIDLSNDNELAQLLGDTTGAPKYNKIRDYVLGLLGGQKITLSDGKNAIVDKSDALHIANKAASKKISQISKIKEIIEKAQLYAEDNNVEHNKFDYFCYYRAFVRVGKDMVPVYLNVGKGINDGKYHIYDITNKIRDTAHRINGVERPKPNEGYALQTVSLDYTVPQDSTDVNSSISDSGRNYTNNSNDNSRHHTHAAEQAYIKRICEALGIKMQFVDITTKLMKSYGYDFTEDTLPDGFYNKEDGILYIGFTGVDPVKFVLKHELTHFGEGTKQYNKFVQAVRNSQAYRDWLVERGKFDVNEDSFTDIERTVRQMYIDARKGAEPGFNDLNAQSEMIADFVGKCLFGNDSKALERLVSNLDYKQAETVWQHIKEFLSYLKRKLSGEKDLMWEITRLENRFNRVLSEAVETKKFPEPNGGIKFTIKRSTEGKQYVQVNMQEFANIDDAKEIAKTLSAIVKNKFNDFVDVSGQKIGINSRTAREWQRSKDAQYLLANKKQKYTDKLNAFENADELLKASRDYVAEEIKHTRKDNFKEFARGVVDFKVNNQGYTADIIVGTTNSNIALLYDIVGIQEKEIEDASHTTQGRRAETSSNDIILNEEQTVKNNISDSGANNTGDGLKFTISRALDEEKIKRAEEIEGKSKGDPTWEQWNRLKTWGEIGLVRDPSGVWVYEIDDSKMKIYPDGDRLLKKFPDYEEYLQLRDNFDDLTSEQIMRFADLDDKYLFEYDYDEYALKNYIEHDELFARYPQLNETRLYFKDLSSARHIGYFDFEDNAIVLADVLLDDEHEQLLAEVLVHEIQHAAQYFDKRENGSNIEYWNQRLKLGTMPQNPHTGKEYTPIEAYYDTQGEYEARMSSERLWESSEDKKDWDGIPYLGNEKLIALNKERAKGSLKFSIPTDREYSEAIKNGDTQALQQMVDNKAMASGYTERLYHQTGADFTEFNTDNQKAGKYDWELPTGMFLKPSDNDIGLKGKKQMDLYAKQQNPLKFRDRAEAQRYWRDNVEGYTDAADEILRIDTEYQNKYEVAVQNTRNYLKEWRRNNPGVDSRQIYNDTEYQRLNDLEDSIADEWEAENDKASLAAKKLIDNYIAKSDYDGVVLENDIGAMGRQTKTYIVFDSSQLKDASPITYDDSGKVIPLSERFSGDKKDIRFTVPTRDFEKENQDLRRVLVETQEWAEGVSERITAHYEKEMSRLQKRYNNLKKKLSNIHHEASVQITKQREERADKMRNIDCIRRSVSRMDAKLRANTDAKHVPQELKQLAHIAISAFRFNDPSPFKRENLHAVKAFYNDAYQTAKENPDALNARYDEQIVDMLVKLEERLEGKTLRKMTLSETVQVRSIVEHIEWLINNENKLFIAGKKQDAIQVGLEELADLTSKATKRQIVGTETLEKIIITNNMTPVYFFDEIGGALRKVFGDIVKGQDKWYRNVELAKAYILDIKEKYHYSEWENDTFSFTTESGDNIEITREQALLLYATARREYGNNYKNTQHLFEGGVVIPPSEKMISDIVAKFRKALKDGETTRESAVKALTQEIDSSAHKIAKEDVMKVFDWLTKEQVQYADALVEYLSNDMALLGNETSMEVAGFKKYNESYYIPYNSASNFIAQHSAVTSDAKLKHQSFTKSVSPHANTPLILSDFSEVCADHINRMCMYNALTVPLETMEKIMNFKMPSKDKDGNDIDTAYAGKSVESELERVYGADAVKYIWQFIDDMNGNVRKTEAETPANKLVSKFKKGAVMASASVMVQQPSAIMRTMAYIDPKYLLGTGKYNLIKSYEELVEHCAVAGIKEMGRFDTSTGVSTTKWLLLETPRGAKNKAKAFFDFKDSSYRDDILSLGAAWADQITWTHIWEAVKAEVADKGKYTQETEEFFEACAARFTFVINHTQVYDSTLSRSHLMRSKNIFDNMVSSFMSEPTVSLNMLMSAVRAAGTKTKVGKKFAVRAVGALICNVLLNTALKSLVTAARDDDEDETYLEKYLSAFRDNFIQDINPLNWIPYVKDFISIVEGYTVERADMSLVDDLAKSIKMFANDNKSIDEKLESLAGSLSAFIGVPTKNVLRDLRAAWNVINMSFIDKTKGDLQGAVFAATGVEGKEKYSALITAAEKGNTAEYNRIYKHLLNRGVEPKDIKTKVESAYKEDKEVIKQTDKLFKSIANNETFKSFDDKTREELKDEIAGFIAGEKTVKAMVKDFERFDTLYKYKRENKVKYEKLKEEMRAEGLPENLIAKGEKMAKIAYIESLGIDIAEYLLCEKAMSQKYADTDNSGDVSEKEKREALDNVDIEINFNARSFLLK